MNETHIHLLITHLPIIGTALGAFVLIHGLWRKSNSTFIAAYNILILSALGAGIAYITGEGAEESVEHLQRFSERVIEEHAESAEVSLIALIVIGFIAAIGVFATLKNLSLARPLAWIVLITTFIGFAPGSPDRLFRWTDQAYRNWHQSSPDG
ncbi:hypothetical protein HK413_03100 [Mucilaginibacter sp. S1162]|uniref:DUF2231 domain-containing protein n=1 Tax=Mucilaginibacter humi TaxID=2732510 RepID=A0ABX1W2F2_9SPHI|nr:hypothetical protein [Mucilaginibacter humi]NNU33394.1 hypothetical protein [Mucilaginibacter humi]